MRSTVTTMVLLLLLTVTGCGKKNSDKIIGLWRTSERQGATYGFLEVKQDSIVIDDGERVVEVSLEDGDDAVTIRETGRGAVFAVISLVGEDSIDIHYPAQEDAIRMQRSSADELAELFHPSHDAVMGWWKSVDEGQASGLPVTLAVGDDSFGVDGDERPAVFSTRQGLHVIADANGIILGQALRTPDGFLHLQVDGLPEVFQPCREDEYQALLAELAERTARHFGFWLSTRPDRSGRRTYLEIGPDWVDVNGERYATRLEWSNAGLAILREGDDSPFLTVLVRENGSLYASRGDGTPDVVHRHADRRELERHRNPRLRDYIGHWLADKPEAGGFTAVCIGEDYIIRDRRREPLAVIRAENSTLQLARPVPVRMDMCLLTRVGGRFIRLGYGDKGRVSYGYRRVSPEEYTEAVESIVNPLTHVAGFWRSAEPVEDTAGERSAHATVALALNVLGSGGTAVDWASESFLQPSGRNRALGSGDSVREGVFVFPNGKVSEPIELKRIDGGPGSWLQVKVVDKDTLDIATDGRNFVRCVRTTREDLVQLRKKLAR